MDNLIALLTPPGKAALASLAVEGPEVWPALAALLLRKHGKSQGKPRAGDIWLGKLGESATTADDVVVGIHRTEPTPRAEIHCHGGPQVVGMILDLFFARGFREVRWTELPAGEKTVSPNLLELLSRAPTLRTAGILLDQLQGASARLMESLASASPEERSTRLERFASLASLGRHLVEPWKVALAGAPNVGKSSLVNAIAGYPRSIVSPIPGTTRDVVATSLAIDGWPVELLDTAGLRDSAGDIEAAGVERARTTLSEVDLVLWVTEAGASESMPSLSTPCLIVVNKIDLLPDVQREEGTLYISARTGDGLADLLQAISKRLVPHPPKPGEAVPVGAEQIVHTRGA